jgi:hypothetical protein
LPDARWSAEASRKLPKCSKCGLIGHRKNVCGEAVGSSFPVISEFAPLFVTWDMW